MYHNPAGLIRIDGLEVNIAVASVGQNVMFDRADEQLFDGDGAVIGELEFAPVENVAAPLVIPSFGVAKSYDEGPLADTVFAFGFFTPYGPSNQFDDNGAQRYTLTDSQLIQASLGPAFATRVHDWVTVGGGVYWSTQTLKESLAINVFSPFELEASATDNANYDVSYAISATDNNKLNWNAGLLIEPPEGAWSLGLFYQPSVSFEAVGSIDADFGNHEFFTGDPQLILEQFATDEEVTVGVTMPAIARAGLAIRPIPALELEATVVWEGWSVLESILVTGLDLIVETTLGDIPISGDVALPAGYQDTLSYRFGGDYEVSDLLTFRAGYFIEQSAVPSQSVGVNAVDADKSGFGLGLSMQTGALTVDFGYGRTQFDSQEITDSAVEAIEVHGISGVVSDTGKIVGNGLYESSIDMAYIGFTWSFGG
jgi:long-chain fatty acid transport protein